ncbi:FxsA family protein [Roseinatronobacter alkalisoli]|uniref:FxsA family protein n=1 Tax=Roseinatronobacter alkalisoli TaxID=3028235 RepID=A0ABT5T9Z0_9RHOB|nr:FxsA family protein [Roseinatronobacter sp. HJB301]MDD7971904.1 FxsA family protein [Roseinatronobacter sp. HJB301]
MRILIAILAVPVIEIALFVQLGSEIGVIATLAWVFATAALGVMLMRLEPHRNAESVRAALARDASPASPMAHSALRMIGALLVVLPGFFTDTLGMLLLLPPVRALILSRLVLQTRAAHSVRPARDDIIDGDYETQPEVHENPHRLPPQEKRD